MDFSHFRYKQLDSGFSPRRPGFSTSWLQARFIISEVAFEQIFLLLIVIPPLLRTHLSPPHEVCDSCDQASLYHTLGPTLGASSLIQHLLALWLKVVHVGCETDPLLHGIALTFGRINVRRLYIGSCDGVRLPSEHCGLERVVLSPGDSECDRVSKGDRLGLTPNLSTRALWPSPETPLEQ
jgi:hypothetical protein